MNDHWLWKRSFPPRRDGEHEDYATCEIGEHAIGEQAPCFRATFSGWRKERIPGEAKLVINGKTHWLGSCGASKDLVARVWPELAPYCHWHLTYRGEGPMHYEANAIYWYEKHASCSQWKVEPYGPDPLDAFKSTVVFGAVEDDEATFATAEQEVRNNCAPLSTREYARKVVKRVIGEWCAGRLERLKAAYERDMETLKTLEVK